MSAPAQTASEVAAMLEKLSERVSYTTAGDLNKAASLIRQMEAASAAQSERERVLVELLAPMAACGARIPEHAWDDDWYMLDGQDSEGKPFDKVEQKFLCSNLRRAAALTKAQP